MTFIYILLSLILSLLAIFIIAGYVIFLRVCKRRPERPDTFEGMFNENKLSLSTEARLREDYDWFDKNRTDEISITSMDGLKLYATVINAKKESAPKGVVIIFHGYRSSARRDTCMQMRILHEAGYHLIVADQRAHGRSEGKYICYGTKERFDAMAWRKKAADIFGKDMPTALMGLSMGGATVLMASALADSSDKALRCVVADCPFSSPWDIVSYVIWKRHRIYPKPILFFVNFWCRALAKFDLTHPTSAKCASSTHLPILIIHGDRDGYVPHHHSVDIVNASPKKSKLSLFENADHGEAIFYDEERYTTELLSFLNDNMGLS